ncbi:ribosome hibernation-promoting factor, HPF/YfiA family [Candidatus Nitrospira bockiana]
MQVMITGRHIEVTSALRRYVETRLKRLERYGVKMGGVQVILNVEKYRHTAEVIAPVNGAVIQGKTSTTEMYASIDQLFDKVSRQLVKRKEKRTDHKPRPVRARALTKAPKVETPAPEIETVRTPLHALTVAQAVDRLDRESLDWLVFKDRLSDEVRILRRSERGVLQLIEPQAS